MNRVHGSVEDDVYPSARGDVQRRGDDDNQRNGSSATTVAASSSSPIKSRRCSIRRGKSFSRSSTSSEGTGARDIDPHAHVFVAAPRDASEPLRRRSSDAL